MCLNFKQEFKYIINTFIRNLPIFKQSYDAYGVTLKIRTRKYFNNGNNKNNAKEMVGSKLKSTRKVATAWKVQITAKWKIECDSRKLLFLRDRSEIKNRFWPVSV